MKVKADWELSFEWSHHRILSTDSKVRATLQSSSIHSGSKRVIRAWALAKQYTWEDSLWTTLFVTDNTQETKLTGKIPLAGGSLWAIASEQQTYFRWNKSWKMRLIPAGYVSKDTGEIKQLGNFLLKILFGNMDTLVSFFECKGTWT